MRKRVNEVGELVVSVSCFISLIKLKWKLRTALRETKLQRPDWLRQVNQLGLTSEARIRMLSLK